MEIGNLKAMKAARERLQCHDMDARFGYNIEPNEMKQAQL